MPRDKCKDRIYTHSSDFAVTLLLLRSAMAIYLPEYRHKQVNQSCVTVKAPYCAHWLPSSLLTISANDEKAYLEEIKSLASWCQDNSLVLNVSKTNELIEDFSTKLPSP